MTVNWRFRNMKGRAPLLWICAWLVSIMCFLVIFILTRNHSEESERRGYTEVITPTEQSRIRLEDAENENEIRRYGGMQVTDLEHCDSECRLLQSQLRLWPLEKPKAFIYLLVKFEEPSSTQRLLQTLDEHFNNAFSYPVVIFHEKHQFADLIRSSIKLMSKSEVYFQTVEFEIPDFLPRNLTQRSCHWSLGYRHMCRFHAKLIYEHPIIRGFEYAWRLDDDSEILQTIEFDVFEYMRKNDLQYGYAIVRDESPSCTVDLWESAALYVRKNLINATFFENWRKYVVYYNNFEISRLSLWLSDDYQNFIDYIDRLGGIYYYRWGDAPIKTIAVSMFVPRNQTHHFKDIGYSHQGSNNW